MPLTINGKNGDDYFSPVDEDDSTEPKEVFSHVSHETQDFEI